MSAHEFPPQHDLKPGAEQDALSGRLARFGAKHYLLAGAVGLLALASMVPSFSLKPLVPAPLSAWADSHLRIAPRQDLVLAVTASPSTHQDDWQWQALTIRSGENLSTLFRRAGLQPKVMHQVLADPLSAKQLRNLHPGRQLQFRLDAAGVLQTLKYEQDALVSFVADFDGQAYRARQIEKPVATRRQYASAEIISSLFGAGEKAGISDAMIMELANIFGYDIDFALDLRQGDRFSLVYDEKLVDGVPYGSGTLLAAEFINQGQTHRAVRYVGLDGSISYYAPDGKALRKAFMRSPLQFSRVSSNFNPARKHPILNIVRAHKGVDYSAPSGTPVHAAGSGRVSFLGTKNGYGRIVALTHSNQFATHYAHLSRFAAGLHNGSRVQQGQVIGYVGMSGVATSPHLHYEFLVNGVFKNPRTVALPQAEPIARAEQERFLAATFDAVQELRSRNRLLVASAH